MRYLCTVIATRLYPLFANPHQESTVRFVVDAENLSNARFMALAEGLEAFNEEFYSHHVSEIAEQL